MKTYLILLLLSMNLLASGLVGKLSLKSMNIYSDNGVQSVELTMDVEINYSSGCGVLSGFSRPILFKV